jgi:hypothetical protein
MWKSLCVTLFKFKDSRLESERLSLYTHYLDYLYFGNLAREEWLAEFACARAADLQQRPYGHHHTDRMNWNLVASLSPVDRLKVMGFHHS